MERGRDFGSVFCQKAKRSSRGTTIYGWAFESREKVVPETRTTEIEIDDIAEIKKEQVIDLTVSKSIGLNARTVGPYKASQKRGSRAEKHESEKRKNVLAYLSSRRLHNQTAIGEANELDSIVP
ncbi:hypothetical protein BDM02DRAFT_1798497 [Thelephora ganbajun]|uniref:Uncharacterized protein n=1 Tax=Thelephora ganbajun TaxID=370292 RepID=A0ACB6Z0L6_THEGA|nr:hypothetical protein BDM02DRAFT_1798497 [Thelephora ganbajun]